MIVMLAAAGMASAAGTGKPSSPVPASHRFTQAKTPKALSRKLLGTVIEYGGGGSSLPGGFYTVDTVTISCGSDAGCTIENLMASQVGSNSAAGNLWAICGLVDGFYMNPTCPYQSTMPTDSSYVSGFAGQSYTVTKGKHTLTTQVYTAAAATLGNWQTTYNIYTP